MLNILLAEDNKVDEVATIEYLQNNLGEIQVKVVPSCKGLISLLESGETFDIIILDHILEDEQSLKYVEKIKARANGAEIIVLSGQSDISVCIQYLNSGVYAYLNKENNSFKNLVKNINEIVAKKKGTISYFQTNKTLLYSGLVALFIIVLIIYYFITK
jgi:DNA-binding NarL/FixJ family response regulator